jgi:hypothetical protein
METLKKNLSPEAYDDVRKALGLKPLVVATKEGQKISQKVRENIAVAEFAATGKKF